MPQTIFGILFIFLMTTLGSAVVFFFKKQVNKNFYKFIDKIISDMPDLTIENCGSGAMRCDNSTLKHFHLQSVSDQEIFTNNPSIIRGMQCCMPPEKMGIWSFPFPLLYEHRLSRKQVFTEEYMQKMSDGEQTIYNMLFASIINKVNFEDAEQIILLKQ